MQVNSTWADAMQFPDDPAVQNNFLVECGLRSPYNWLTNLTSQFTGGNNCFYHKPLFITNRYLRPCLQPQAHTHHKDGDVLHGHCTHAWQVIGSTAGGSLCPSFSLMLSSYLRVAETLWLLCC